MYGLQHVSKVSGHPQVTLLLHDTNRKVPYVSSRLLPCITRFFALASSVWATHLLSVTFWFSAQHTNTAVTALLANYWYMHVFLSCLTRQYYDPMSIYL